VQLFKVIQFCLGREVAQKLFGTSFGSMLLIVTAVFLLLYAALIFYYFYHWLHIKTFKVFEKGNIKISVVVAARNEEKNISNLLKALNSQTYPSQLFEVIIVDDFSTDGTAAEVQPFLCDRIKMIQPEADKERSSKKKAIKTGIDHATGDLMVITDADCIPPDTWVETIASFQQITNAAFIAAPVRFITEPSLLSVFQSLDFITLQGITAASVEANFHSMCNGANLAYLRKSFYEAGGFDGIDKIASGDDMLLMYKIWKQQPKRVHYLHASEAIVETKAMPTWKHFFQQRIRWSGKATYYSDKRVMIVLFFVYFFNLLFLIILTFCFFNSDYLMILFYYLVGKTIIEFPFVYSVAKFYNRQNLMIYFPFFQPLHILYTIAIGFISQFGTYQWKGRQTK
jgi:cellulose synthase/poly-beta-1,6-N-acetylglucosamine synthase-like glycosyltransferase